MPTLDNALNLIDEQRFCRFVAPNIKSYEMRKNLKVHEPVKPRIIRNETGDSNSFLPELKELSFSNKAQERAYLEFFKKRLLQAASGKDLQSCGLFPGTSIPAPGKKQEFLKRGALFFEQFLHLLSFDEGAPNEFELFGARRALNLEPLEAVEVQSVKTGWPFTFIDKPRLYFICEQARTKRIDAIESTSFSNKMKAAHRFLERIQESMSLMDQNSKDLIHYFDLIHRSWSGMIYDSYDENVLESCRTIYRKLEKRLPRARRLPFIFELEAMAVYMSFQKRLKPFASGYFAQNWVDIGSLALSECRATELCVNDRLLDELLQIPERGFAPVVINEFLSIADGNHRLLSAWLWNLLEYCKDESWSLDNEPFQDRLAQYVHKYRAAMGPVIVHESLSHLSRWLSNQEQKKVLETSLPQFLRKRGCIRELPAVFLPEYLSGAVIKDSYETSARVERAHPQLYAGMQNHSHAVLRPRASYHFSDMALLPWLPLFSESGTFPKPEQKEILSCFEN